MESLAFGNYRAFIETARCASVVGGEIHSINEAMRGAIASLPRLVAQCNAFCSKAALVARERQVK